MAQEGWEDWGRSLRDQPGLEQHGRGSLVDALAPCRAAQVLRHERSLRCDRGEPLAVADDRHADCRFDDAYVVPGALRRRMRATQGTVSILNRRSR